MSKFDDMITKVQGMIGNTVGKQPVLNQDINSPTISQAVNQFAQAKPTQQNIIGGILNSVSPEDDVTQAFTHNLGAIMGDVTHEFQPQEIQSAIQQLQGKSLTGDYYQDNAIKLANYLHAKSSGAVVNSPLGGNQ